MSDYSHDWWTPKPWLDWVDRTLGPYFDPCPRYKCETYDGLKNEWDGNAFYVNHPGGRGNAQLWWEKTRAESCDLEVPFIWCAFNIEQLRTLKPSPLVTPGYIIAPKKRLKFLWGGPTQEDPPRIHGEPCKSPTRWTVFWSSAMPANPPEDCYIWETGNCINLSSSVI